VWAEPRVEAPPRPWWDIALVAVLVPATVAEGLLRSDVPLPGLSIALALVCVLALLWRRSHPAVATVVAFASQTLAGLVPDWTGRDYGVLLSTSCVLLLLYSLGRWASGRGVVLATGFVLLAHVVREPFYESSAVSMLVGAGFLLMPVAVGAAVRFQTTSRGRQVEQVRMREREQLARELHDTVAHHVSGILIQAQAGRAVAAADPSRAVAVLGVIEEEANRSLVEMRAIVGVLRDGAEAERSPVPGIADVARLARDGTGRLPVELAVDGELEQLEPVVGTAVYRLVQESVTNAQRHAREATLIRVRVVSDDREVTVTVTDDGRTPAPPRPGGFGLTGMAERVSVLGGRLEAGPRPGGGWSVTATLPRPEEAR
jgi:two-component sensor histidine kinase